ncbi:hypothetical protein A3K79_05660 [Candidatus Bathyarchaeota archaeon RBG_13_46_16b]|nr:MAG: hypothetical protein A3K79_05660 [Candidatus Bathyarchaeota archaeon RBG_13_46_16b]
MESELAPNDRFVLFSIVFGVVVISLLSFVDAGISYTARYAVALLAIAIYALLSRLFARKRAFKA